MIFNPKPGPHGEKTPANEKLPPLNPEIRKWFEERQKHLKIVKTTRTPRGQTIDWIPIESQSPTRIATPPPTPQLPPIANRNSARFELDDAQVERGPPGTVPVLRKDLSALHETSSLKDYLSKRGGQKVNKDRRSVGAADPNPAGYWHVTSGQTTTVFGCEGWLNVWEPYVETSTDHSLMQCGMQNYDQATQSLEAGWTVDHGLNGDWVPHVFTYYTTNGYSGDGDNLGGYNRDVAGWVQYDSSVFPGATINGISTSGGTQLGISIKYMLYQSNWWFAVQGIWLGYYPASLFMGNQSVFSTLGDHGEWTGFWGEVYSAVQDPSKTHDQMGSGLLAERGWTYACYQSNLRNQTDRAGGLTDHNGLGSVDAPSTAIYDIDMHMASGSSWGSYFYGGGPGS